jgi:hypothetical protein
VIDDASGDPSQWTIRIVAPALAPAGIAVGAGGVAVDAARGTVLALSEREPGDHAGFLARWSIGDLAAGRVDAAAWWNGTDYSSTDDPVTIMADAGPESSMHLDASGVWLHVRSDGFGATTIVVAAAAAPEGPWSSPVTVFRPPESDRPDAFVYAAKAHPELEAGGGALAVTYATNTMAGLAALVSDTSLYYPRFVRLAR